MPRRGKRRAFDLFPIVASFDALVSATRRAVRGKRRVPGAARFMAGLETHCLAIERALVNRTWQPGGYTVFRVDDPKPRRISAAPFRDRVVHHALCHVIGPIFDRGFTADSFANRTGMGTHAAVLRFERNRDRYAYVLRGDIYRYFPAIDHTVLKQDVARRIGCPDTLWLVGKIIDGSNPQEPVNLHFPGDDLLTPLCRRRGLPIGNLTSQLFANVYLDPLDHFVRERLSAGGYVRYVDDFALFDDDPVRLAAWRTRIDGFLAKRRLKLHPNKTTIHESRHPHLFLGYILHLHGLRRLPKENVRRFANRLRGLRDRWQSGSVTEEAVRQRVCAWIAHAEHADTAALRTKLFGSGWFAPDRLASDRIRRRSLAGP